MTPQERFTSLHYLNPVEVSAAPKVLFSGSPKHGHKSSSLSAEAQSSQPWPPCWAWERWPLGRPSLGSVTKSKWTMSKVFGVPSHGWTGMLSLVPGGSLSSSLQLLNMSQVCKIKRFHPDFCLKCLLWDTDVNGLDPLEHSPLSFVYSPSKEAPEICPSGIHFVVFPNQTLGCRDRYEISGVLKLALNHWYFLVRVPTFPTWQSPSSLPQMHPGGHGAQGLPVTRTRVFQADLEVAV